MSLVLKHGGLHPASLRTLCALALLNPIAAHAGGYEGASQVCCRIAPNETKAIVSAAATYRDGSFRVRQADTAGSSARYGGVGSVASGYGSSLSGIDVEGSVTSWKRTVQRANAAATAGGASGNGFSATFLKAQTADGRYFVYKGYVTSVSAASPNGATSATGGFARSAGGRF